MEAGFHEEVSNQDAQIIDSGFIKSPERRVGSVQDAPYSSLFTPPRVNVQAPTLLRNGNFTIQQQSTRLFLTSQTAKVKLLPRTSNEEEDKQTTQHGIIASFRPRSGLENDPEEEDSITHYGSIDDDDDDIDKWIEKVDVSKFEPINREIARRQRKEKERKKLEISKNRVEQPSVYPKPAWSYSSLIALALKNSDNGELTVSEIYAFILENFPYFRTAPSGWKNSVRHNLSLNKCFEKVEELEQNRVEKLEADIKKFKEKNPFCVESLAKPEDIEAIENGTKGIPDYYISRGVMLKTSPLENKCVQEVAHQNYQQQVHQIRYREEQPSQELVRMMGAMCSPSKAYHQHIEGNSENIPSCSKIEHSPRINKNLFHEPNIPISQESSLLDNPFDEFVYDPTLSYHRLQEDVNLNTTSIINQILRTPTKNADKKDESISPYRFSVPGYQFARSALDENSLLSAAVDQSPYKSGATSFEDFDRKMELGDEHDGLFGPMKTYNLEDYRVLKAPSTIFYIPGFASSEECELYKQCIANSPQPKWTALSNRRLQNYGGVVGKKALIPDDDFPPALRYLMKRIDSLKVFPDPVNHILVNEYAPGQGILPHTDGPAFYPTVTTLNLGSHTLLDFYRPIDEVSPASLDERYAGSMFFEEGGLFVMRDDAYTKMLHGIREMEADLIDERVFNAPEDKMWKIQPRVGNRISITVRNVPKVAKFDVKSLIGKSG
ncbi:hypothetical protein WR25_03221 [Diploscapter pachys]|uniref:Fork-head domain-containing protein n=1 Tax=Diploscapter pachys TaxID=2018661 RepID=A0A2A2JQ78_9BILA|nr:hypothetical protein WR25_03221 [Diploscapter pachys]